MISTAYHLAIVLRVTLTTSPKHPFPFSRKPLVRVKAIGTTIKFLHSLRIRTKTKDAAQFCATEFCRRERSRREMFSVFCVFSANAAIIPEHSSGSRRSAVRYPWICVPPSLPPSSSRREGIVHRQGGRRTPTSGVENDRGGNARLDAISSRCQRFRLVRSRVWRERSVRDSMRKVK